MKEKNQKGFTIIELIVVIAIIAVLSTIVAINVTSYISKGKDAAIKGNLSQIATIATTIYENTSSYSTVTTNTTILAANNALNAVIGSSTANTNNLTILSNSTAWCACSILKSNTSAFFCVDSTGYKGQSTSVCNNASKCNTSYFACN